MHGVHTSPAVNALWMWMRDCSRSKHCNVAHILYYVMATEINKLTNEYVRQCGLTSARSTKHKTRFSLEVRLLNSRIINSKTYI